MSYNYKNWRAVSNTNLNVIGAEFETEKELITFIENNPGFHKRYVRDDEIKKERFDEINSYKQDNALFGLKVTD